MPSRRLSPSRFPFENVPGVAHVGFGRARAADCQPQRVATVQLGVREEDLARRVDALEQRLVLLVRALATEADEREWARRGHLPTGLGANPRLEERGQLDRPADPALQPLAPVGAQNSPELERPELAPERR